MKALLLWYGLGGLFVCVVAALLLAKVAPRRLVLRDGEHVNLVVLDLISLGVATAVALASVFLWGWPLKGGLLLVFIPLASIALGELTFSTLVLYRLRSSTETEPEGQDET